MPSFALTLLPSQHSKRAGGRGSGPRRSPPPPCPGSAAKPSTSRAAVACSRSRSWRRVSSSRACFVVSRGGRASRARSLVTGTPKESELDSRMIETFVPTTWLLASRIGPPLIPELSGIDSSIRSTTPFSAKPLKTPSIKESPRPSGFPKATIGRAGGGGPSASTSGRPASPATLENCEVVDEIEPQEAGGALPGAVPHADREALGLLDVAAHHVVVGDHVPARPRRGSRCRGRSSPPGSRSGPRS